MHFKRIFPILISVSALIILLSGCGEQTIDVSQYIEVEFSGLDSRGTASLSRRGLDSAIEDVIFGEDDTLEESFAKLSAADNVESSVNIKLDKDDELSNGDVVTVHIDVNDKLAKDNGIKFTGTDDMKFTVTGLKEITEIDPFDEKVFNVESGEGIYIDFTDVSPRANIQIRNTLPDSNPLSKVKYYTEEDYYDNIKKGQSIAIKAEAPSSWEDDGFLLAQDSTTVECTNVAEYIRSVDDIDNETMQKIVNQCNDLYKSKYETYSNEYDVHYKNDEGNTIQRSYINSISDFKYKTEYFLALKDGLDKNYSSSWFGSKSMEENGLFITCTVNLNKVKESYFSKETFDVKNAVLYFYVYDIVKSKDGEIQFKTDMVNYSRDIYNNEDTFKTTILNTYLDKFDITDEKAADFK